jgi:NAD(P)H-dependent FMN reductase
MLKIAIIIGSTRPNRVGPTIAQYVYEIAKKRGDADYELIDIADYGLPLLDEPNPPGVGEYTQPHTIRWAKKIETFDGYVFVTPEYNNSTSGALKNAIDFLYREWHNKAAGFVGYGATQGVRAVQALRSIMAQMRMADVGAQAGFSIFTDFTDGVFKPEARREKEVNAMLDQLIAWAGALKTLREKQ